MRKPTSHTGADGPRSDPAQERARDADAAADRAVGAASGEPTDIDGDMRIPAARQEIGADAEGTPESEGPKAEAGPSASDSLVWPPPEEELNGWEIIQLETTGRTFIEPMRPPHDSGPRLTATPLPAPATPPPAPRLYSTIPTPPAVPLPSERLAAAASPPVGPTPPHLSLHGQADENLPETQVIEPFMGDPAVSARALDLRPAAPAPPAVPSTPPAPPQAPRQVAPQVIVQGGPAARATVSARERTQPRIIITPPGALTPSVKPTVPPAMLDDTVDPGAQTRIMPIPADLLRPRVPATMVETLRDEDTAPVNNDPHAYVRPAAAPITAPATLMPLRGDTSIPPRGGTESWRPDTWRSPSSFRTNASALDPTPALPVHALGSGFTALEDTTEANSVLLPEPRRTPVWRIALIVIALVAIAEVAYLLVRTLQPSAATPVTGTLVVESTPSGAEVSIDGAPKGRTPFRAELAPGAHAVDVRSGTLQQTRTVTLQAGVVASERVDLGTTPASAATPNSHAVASAATATLEVRSDPAGARVTIGGVDRGRTPVTVAGLNPGHVQVRISGPFRATREMELSPGQQAHLVVTAPRAPAPAPTPNPDDSASQAAPKEEPPSGRPAPAGGRGWITIDSPLVLRVVRNGDFLGTSEDGRIPLPSGTHVIGLENESVNFRAVRTVEVQPNRGVTVAVALPQGTLSINALPWAEVSIDNQVIGETPVSQLALSIGPHEVVFRHPQFGERRVTVIVKVGTPGRTFVDFTK